MSRGHVLRRPHPDGRPWLRRLLAEPSRAHSFHVSPRDMAGTRALAELQDRGLHQAAVALARSADHVEGFFEALRAELAFYVGHLNLHERIFGDRT